ncbi:MAG: FkbM family methyltransferase [Nitrososphaerota archaeon]|nr:FkbM family methyltransferase [Nitrososphaerota archaeon]
MTKNRFLVLKYWLLHSRNSVPSKELLKFFFDTSYHEKAKRYIQDIRYTESDVAVRLKGISSCLYYPKDTFNLKSLEQVVVEQCYEDNWHYYETPETRIESNDVVVDCGAAEGLFSLRVCSRCERVYAIEPLSEFVNALRKTFALQPQVTIIPAAVSDKEGEAFIENRGISSTLSLSQGERVKVETLDSLFFKTGIHISYIKADLEGADYLALRGAEHLIRTCTPKIAITTYHDPNHARLMMEWIGSINPRYNFKLKGIYQITGSPMMLHAWV